MMTTTEQAVSDKIAVEMRCNELAFELAETIEKADGSWCYEGDDMPSQFVRVLKPLVQKLVATERETDPTPITLEFAEQVAVGRNELPWSDLTWLIISERMSIKRSEGVFSLTYNNHVLIDNPTIGQFWTAVRLFSVKVKGA